MKPLHAAARRLAAHPETAELGVQAMAQLGVPTRHCKVCEAVLPVPIEGRGRPPAFCSEHCRTIWKAHQSRVQYSQNRQVHRLAYLVAKQILASQKQAGQG